MSRRFVFVIAAALPLAFASNALAEEAPAAATPAAAPAEAVALPTPAPAETPVPTSEDLRELNWAGLGLRIGVLSFDVSADGVPGFSDKVDDVVKDYNSSLPEGIGKIASSAMDFEASLVQVIPTLHLGGDGFFFRLDVPIGFGDDVTAMGVGMYPLAYGYFIESLGLFPYAAAGLNGQYLTASKVEVGSTKVDVDQSGFLFQTRLALGAKYRTVSKLNAVAEIGFSPVTIAGVYDSKNVDAINKAADESTIPTVTPAEAVRAGMGSTVDFSLGVEWL